MIIYLAGPMEEDHEGNEFTHIAEWRLKIKNTCERWDWVCPEDIETEYDNHGFRSNNVPRDDLALIRGCDLLFALVDSEDRIGTFCEIAMGAALRIQSVVAVVGDNLPWFVAGLSTEIRYFQDKDKAIDFLIERAGGPSVNYYKYIQSSAWKEKADAAKLRAGNKCQVCNSEGQLDAHHRTYERLGKEIPEDITVLCRNCHELYEKSKKKKK